MSKTDYIKCKDTLKVIVKEGFEKDFEKYCSDKNIYYKVYPLEIFKTRYKVKAKKEDFIEVIDLIKSIEPMPTIALD